jgi:HNH endonuclease
MASALAKQVAVCNKRSREKGLAGTLTTLDWQRSLEFFNQQCAYCGNAHAWTIDHFQPLVYGGGSTHSNVVPACNLCNNAKASSLIHELPSSFISPERLKAIETYLEAIGKRNQGTGSDSASVNQPLPAWMQQWHVSKPIAKSACWNLPMRAMPMALYAVCSLAWNGTQNITFK